LQLTLSCISLVTISKLGNIILAELFILKLLKMTFHNDLLLGFVQHLQTLMEEGCGVLLVGLLCSCYFHGWAVITNLASYIANRFEYENHNFKLIRKSPFGHKTEDINHLLFFRTDTSVGG
jgi:hypothetical protein